MGGGVPIGIGDGEEVAVRIVGEDGRAAQGVDAPGESVQRIIAELRGPAQGVGLAEEAGDGVVGPGGRVPEGIRLGAEAGALGPLALGVGALDENPAGTEAVGELVPIGVGLGDPGIVHDMSYKERPDSTPGKYGETECHFGRFTPAGPSQYPAQRQSRVSPTF